MKNMGKNALRILTLPQRIRNLILFIIYKFDKWHISPFGNRIYPLAIINYVKGLYPLDRICEIGCGLGDTISRLDGKYLLGLDCDENVLRAASFIHKKNQNLHFRKFEFPINDLDEKFDLIIAINWLHGINETITKKYLSEYFNNNLNSNGYLIVDSVANMKYKYFHDFEKYFSDSNCIISIIGQFQSGRKVFSIKKNHLVLNEKSLS
jgi:cyclopropane fatty-acyl-phospholipid synthase-like methyltransferase